MYKSATFLYVSVIPKILPPPQKKNVPTALVLARDYRNYYTFTCKPISHTYEANIWPPDEVISLVSRGGLRFISLLT